MTTTSHDSVREALLDGEPSDLRGELLAHYRECADCAAFGRALSEIDEGLGGLLPTAAPPELLARTRAAVDELPREVNEPAPAGMTALFLALLTGSFSGIWALLKLLVAPLGTRRPWMIAIPAVAALGIVFVGGTAFFGGAGLFVFSARGPELEVASRPTDSWVDHGGAFGGDAPSAAPAPALDLDFHLPEGSAAVADEERDGRFYYGIDGPDDSRDHVGAPNTATREVERSGYRGEPAAANQPPSGDRGAEVTGPMAQGVVLDGLLVDGRGRGRNAVDLPPGNHRIVLAETEQDREHAAAERRLEPGDHLRAQTSERSRILAADQQGQGDDGEVDRTVVARPAPTPSSGTAGETADMRTSRSPDSSGREAQLDDEMRQRTGALGHAPADEATLVPRANEGDLAFASTVLSSAREQTEGLTFHSPTGYWANTYVPGDPAIRSLRRRLADYPAAVELAELAQPGEPGLSAPRSGALSLDVTADRAQVEGRSRVLMSVGLRGAAQRAGRRPALRAQVVLDLRGRLDEDGEGRVRALLSSLGRRRDGADRVGVMVAGPDGGTRVELGTMRFGELAVALRRTFGPTPDEASPRTLRESLEDAIASVGQLGQDAPLGSSMVLLVTPGLSDADSRELARSAHAGALAGVTTTVIGLDDSVALDSLERVALAGQGRRRVLESAGSADELVRAEITAVSRVLARAVRLRIRLASGVQLVDVIGSRSLDEVEAQRVREAEQAIDQALARRLGITSDRGEDEDGIQIVIPAFYADDAHHVLLDLVVPGPGPVADVQVRFKDLLRLGNGTLTDRLVISRGGAARGPAERAVYAAWLGHELSGALRAAASELDRGQPDAARASLEGARRRVLAAWAAIPELASEPALTRDVSLCQRYRDALAAQPADVMASSLRFAAHRRLLGDPLGLGGDR